MQPCDRLTAKEVQVAMLVWEGQTNREIGNVIGTTEQVIKNYLRNTFDKLGVWSRLELALYVAAHGGLHWRDPVAPPPPPAALAAEAAHPPQPATQRSSALVAKNDHGSRQTQPASKVLPGLISA
jgi:DNA-binding CsgD family transcriptional regulator